MHTDATGQSGRSLYLAVRAGFIARGTSLARWCAENQISRQNMRTCLLGAWDGPKAKRLRDQAIKAAGIRR